MPVFESRRLAHDGIRFLEANGETIRLIDGGFLSLWTYHPCGVFARDRFHAYHNHLRFNGKHAVFDEQGIFRTLVDEAR